jgi:hypothetical protein
LATVSVAAYWLVDAPMVSALTTHLYEDFDALPLMTSIDELPPVPNAFTHTAPNGWDRDATGVPGAVPPNPDIGIFEWEGWSFARKSFWQSVGERGRDQFTLGKDTIAVAETDAWNDKGNPANNFGFYDTFLTTPPINFTNADKGGIKLMFNSSWMPGCCDDGERFAPDQNNQRASIRLRFANGNVVPILRWESAPYIDSQGRPSLDPKFPANPFYKMANVNEKVVVDLAPFLTAANGKLARIEYGVTEAGDDGWWAVDVMHVFSLSLVAGDMNIDGLVDQNDVPAFALGVQNPDEYSSTYFGEFPVTRGSPDSQFDFDDIPWFVNILESSGVGSAAEMVQAALVAGTIPEPSTMAMATLLGAVAATIRVRRDSQRSNL